MAAHGEPAQAADVLSRGTMTALRGMDAIVRASRGPQSRGDRMRSSVQTAATRVENASRDLRRGVARAASGGATIALLAAAAIAWGLSKGRR
jgi:predicted NBD/HSP70 family sugar kinase